MSNYSIQVTEFFEAVKGNCYRAVERILQKDSSFVDCEDMVNCFNISITFILLSFLLKSGTKALSYAKFNNNQELIALLVRFRKIRNRSEPYTGLPRDYDPEPKMCPNVPLVVSDNGFVLSRKDKRRKARNH